MAREPRTGRIINANPAMDKPFRTLMDAIPREDLMRALASQPQGSPFRDLLAEMTTDPGPGIPPLLVTQCRKVGVTMPMVLNLFKDAKLTEGTIRMHAGLPDVMGDVAEDARSRMRMCSRCHGKGVVLQDGKEEVCAHCEGTGKVRIVGDRHARDLMFESAGLTKKRGPLIEQNFDMRGNTSLRENMIATQDFLEPSKR